MYVCMYVLVIAETEAEYQSDVVFTKGTPYLALTGELVYIFEKIDRVITARHCIMIMPKQLLILDKSMLCDGCPTAKLEKK